MHAPAGTQAHLAKRVQKRRPICVIPHNRFAMVAAVEKVIDRVRELDACFPGHEPGEINSTVSRPSK